MRLLGKVLRSTVVETFEIKHFHFLTIDVSLIDEHRILQRIDKIMMYSVLTVAQLDRYQCFPSKSINYKPLNFNNTLTVSTLSVGECKKKERDVNSQHNCKTRVLDKMSNRDTSHLGAIVVNQFRTASETAWRKLIGVSEVRRLAPLHTPYATVVYCWGL